MTTQGADFLMPPAKQKKQPDAQPTAAEINSVVEWLEGGAVGAEQLGEGIRKIVQAGVAVLSAGLTERALCLLIQDRLPKKSGGSSHGRPLVEVETIAAVLKAVRELDQHLTPMPDAWKAAKKR